MNWGDGLSIAVYVAGFLVLLFALGRRIGRVETKLIAAMRSLRASMVSHRTLLGVLTKQKWFTPEQAQAIFDPYEKLAEGSIDQLIQELQPSGNPISSEDYEDVVKYLEKIKDIEKLGYKDAIAFYRLAERLSDEEPDSSAWETVLELAAYLLGRAEKPTKDASKCLASG